MQENSFENLTQIGFELELQRVNQQIILHQEKVRNLSQNRAKLYQLAKKLDLKVL